ncbi:MAG: hypothetical protein V7K27_24185 [Nostoc sp.]|uniref:hypothetical protein n=1 Tax=Nostoc sp. TaxID=1180 RepID=UPI002FF65E37
MKTNRIFVMLTICLLSVLAITGIFKPHLVAAQSKAQTLFSNKCSSFVTGTYLTTIFDAKGQLASRGVITLTPDGNFFVIDSNQGGVKEAFNPFGDTQGAYTCTGNQDISATGINFGFSGPDGANDIARSDIRATFHRLTQAVKGTITVRSFALNANPLEEKGSVVGTFPFTGQRVKANSA